MFAEAPENPLFTLGKSIEVMRINPPLMKVELRVHFPCSSEFEFDTLKDKSNEKVKYAMEYLFAEGFIQTLAGWNVEVNLFGHPPK